MAQPQNNEYMVCVSSNPIWWFFSRRVSISSITYPGQSFVRYRASVDHGTWYIFIWMLWPTALRLHFPKCFRLVHLLSFTLWQQIWMWREQCTERSIHDGYMYRAGLCKKSFLSRILQWSPVDMHAGAEKMYFCLRRRWVDCPPFFTWAGKNILDLVFCTLEGCFKLLMTMHLGWIWRGREGGVGMGGGLSNSRC